MNCNLPAEGCLDPGSPRAPRAKVRVAALQYGLRPVPSFEAFAAQVAALVETAAEYRCQLLVFPEYVTLQLLTLGDGARPIRERIQELVRLRPRYLDLFSRLASRHGLYLVGGSLPTSGADGRLFNDCYFFNPQGRHLVQGKLHLTAFERDEWGVSERDELRLFDTALGKVAITVCYDVEFPELARAAARAGARILVVPSCTDDRCGFLRVRYCAQARAIENQMFVIHSGTVGSLFDVPGFALHYGQASILTPSDLPFARDGILAEGVPNQEMMIMGDLDLAALEQSLTRGPVLPLKDSGRVPPGGFGPGTALSF